MESKRITRSILLLLLFLFAAGFRLGFVAWRGGTGLTGDSAEFVQAAKEIAQGHGFSILQDDGVWSPLMTAEPGYSLFLSFWLALGIPIGGGILWVQAIVGGLLAPVIYSFVARRRGERAALVASIFYAIDPLAAATCLFILRELFLMSLILATICAMDVAGRRGTILRGTLIGMTALSFPLYGLWPIWMWVLDRLTARERRVMTIGAAALAFLLIGCWSVRNMTVSQGHYMFRRHVTAVLPYMTSRYDFKWLPDPKDPEFKKIYIEANERFGSFYAPNQRDIEKAILKETWRYFLDQPLTVTWRFIKANFWFWAEVPGAMGLLGAKMLLHRTLVVIHAIQMALFIAGLYFLIRGGQASDYRFVWGTILYLAIFIFPFMPIPRYYSGVLPLIDILAAYGALGVWDTVRRRASGAA